MVRIFYRQGYALIEGFALSIPNLDPLTDCSVRIWKGAKDVIEYFGMQRIECAVACHLLRQQCCVERFGVRPPDFRVPGIQHERLVWLATRDSCGPAAVPIYITKDAAPLGVPTHIESPCDGSCGWLYPVLM